MKPEAASQPISTPELDQAQSDERILSHPHIKDLIQDYHISDEDQLIIGKLAAIDVNYVVTDWHNFFSSHIEMPNPATSAAEGIHGLLRSYHDKLVVAQTSPDEELATQFTARLTLAQGLLLINEPYGPEAAHNVVRELEDWDRLQS